MLVRSHGVRIVGDDTGSGMPIIFVHASPMNRRMWTPQIEVLEDNYRCISIDLRGFGRSDLPVGISDMTTFAEDVIAVLDHLNIGQAVFVGLSMGGYVGMALANAWPNRFSAFVFAGTKCGADAPEVAAGREKLAIQVEQQGVGSIVEAQLGRLLSKGADEDLRQWVRDMIEEATPEGVIAALRGMARRPDNSAAIAKLRVPTLVIVGEDDPITPPSDSEIIANLVPGATLVRIANAGHLVNLEQPALFNEALKTFLDGLPR